MLVGHGTRDELGTKEFLQLGKILQRRLAPLPVVASLLEFQEPTIPQAWKALVDAGVEHIHVAPLLLFAAGHAKQDIPNLIRHCQAMTPQISCDQAGPLSRHRSIIELLRQRSQTHTASRDRQSTALVMVGRGSHDPCAQADMRVLSELIGHRESFATVATAFYAMADPRLPDVLDHVAMQPSVNQILVQPHLLFHGRLYQAIANQVAEAADRHPGIQFHLADYLGPNESIAQAIQDRVFA